MTAPDPPADHFPYAYTPEANLPHYLRFRAEGVSPLRALWSLPCRLRKYRRGRWSAPAEEVAYFREQARLLRELSARETLRRVAFIGDLGWMRDGWSGFLSPEAAAYLGGHDLVVASLDTPVAEGLPVPALLPAASRHNAPAEFLASFDRPGGGSLLSVVTTAGDRLLDRGTEGLSRTLSCLDAAGLAHAGVRPHRDDRPWALVVTGGIRVGVYACGWGYRDPAVRPAGFHPETLAGLAPRTDPHLCLGRVRVALADMAREGVDVRVVAAHWGHEFEFYPAPELMCVARNIVALGADLVVGTHPHVIQPVETCFVNGYEQKYRGAGIDLPAMRPGSGCLLRDGTDVPRKALIAYSLGNFATAMFTLHCRTGLVLSLGLRRDADTGRVEWERPEMQLVHNVHDDPLTRSRRVVLVEPYLRERGREGDRMRAVREYARRMGAHLLG